MKAAFLTVITAACGLHSFGAVGVSPSPKDTLPVVAAGDGSMKFGEDGGGVGYFKFDVKADPKPSGSLLFAAEHHHLYPDEIVRISKITKVTFGRRTAEFSGTGALHDTPVSMTVSIFDGKGSDRPDRFSITCTNDKGEVVLHAEGDVFIGGLVVGTEK